LREPPFCRSGTYWPEEHGLYLLTLCYSEYNVSRVLWENVSGRLRVCGRMGIAGGCPGLVLMLARHLGRSPSSERGIGSWPGASVCQYKHVVVCSHGVFHVVALLVLLCHSRIVHLSSNVTSFRIRACASGGIWARTTQQCHCPCTGMHDRRGPYVVILQVSWLRCWSR